MSVLVKETIGEIAARRPQAATLFEILGIDYSCHGSMTLHEACAAAGLDFSHVRLSLEQLPHDDGDVNWLEQPFAALTRHLRGEVYDAIEEARIAVAARLSDDCARCNALSGETARLRHEFSVISQLLDPHFAAERLALFPILEHFDDCWSRGIAPAQQSEHGLASDIQALVVEHGQMIASVEALRSIVEDIMISSDPCRDVVDNVQAFDHAIRQHVHLANNVLFPRAVALETILTSEGPRQTEVKTNEGA